MTKYLLLTLLFFLLVYPAIKGKKTPGRRPKPPRQSGGSEDMVRCAHCRVFLPKSEGILCHGQYYCCDDHRKRHRA